MKKSKLPGYIHKASLPRRVLSSAIDAILAFGLMSIIYFTIGVNVILANNGFAATTAERTAYIQDPQLLEFKDGKYSYFKFEEYYADTDVYGYEKYSDLVWNYFTVFLPEHANYDYVPTGLKKTSGVEFTSFDNSKRNDAAYVGRWTYENFYSTEFFEPAKNELDQVDYSLEPVLNATGSETDPDGRLTYRGRLRDSFFSSRQAGGYADAANCLVYQSRISDYDSAVSHMQWTAYIPSIVLAPFIFTWLIPVLLPNGKTIGKLICRLGILNSDGYTVKKRQVMIRQSILLLFPLLLLIPNLYVGVLAMLFSVAIFYMFIVLTKTNQGPHDFAAMTRVINTQTSLWFADEMEKQRFVETHPKSPIAIEENRGKEKQKYAPTKEEYGILDSSMIGSARKEAEGITSFDEHEKNSHKGDKPLNIPWVSSIDLGKEGEEEKKPTVDKNDDGFTDDTGEKPN